MSDDTTRDGDAERPEPEFWAEAATLMKEIMDDFAFTRPVRVSLRDVQVSIRNHLARAAETRDAALREAKAEIERLEFVLERHRINEESRYD